MTNIKTNTNNEILINAVNPLRLRFRVAEIERATGFKKSAISGYLNNKVPVSDIFMQTFSEAFKIDLKQFGYTNGMERVETKTPPQESGGFELKSEYDKLIRRYESMLDRLEKELDFERSKNNSNLT